MKTINQLQYMDDALIILYKTKVIKLLVKKKNNDGHDDKIDDMVDIIFKTNFEIYKAR